MWCGSGAGEKAQVFWQGVDALPIFPVNEWVLAWAVLLPHVAMLTPGK